MIAARTVRNRGYLIALAILTFEAFGGVCAASPQMENYCRNLPRHSAASTTADNYAKAQNAWPYAILSNNVYRPSRHPEIWLDPDLWQAVCAPEDQTESAYGGPDCKADEGHKGFAAKTYLKWPQGIGKGEPSELVIVFRGTDDAKDWPFGNIGDAQYPQADAYARARIIKYLSVHPEIKITATGHSLGGGLAQRVAFCFEGIQAIAFNTSPLSHKRDCPRELSRAEKRNIRHTHILRIHQHNEILSPIRHLFSSKDYPDIAYDLTPGSLIKRHGMTSLALGLTAIAANLTAPGLPGAVAPDQASASAAKKALDNTCRAPAPQPVSAPAREPVTNPGTKWVDFGE